MSGCSFKKPKLALEMGTTHQQRVAFKPNSIGILFLHTKLSPGHDFSSQTPKILFVVTVCY